MIVIHIFLVFINPVVIVLKVVGRRRQCIFFAILFIPFLALLLVIPLISDVASIVLFIIIHFTLLVVRVIGFLLVPISGIRAVVEFHAAVIAIILIYTSESGGVVELHAAVILLTAGKVIVIIIIHVLSPRFVFHFIIFILFRPGNLRNVVGSPGLGRNTQELMAAFYTVSLGIVVIRSALGTYHEHLSLSTPFENTYWPRRAVRDIRGTSTNIPFLFNNFFWI